VLKAWISRGNN